MLLALLIAASAAQPPALPEQPQPTIVVTSTVSGTATWRQGGVVLELIYSPSAIDSAMVRRDTLRMAQSVGMFGSTPVIYTR